MDDTPKNALPPKIDEEQIDNLFKVSGKDTITESESEYSLNLDNLDVSFDLPDDSNIDRGLKAILNSGKIYSERLPILDVVFDRLLRLLTTSLRNFTSDNVDVSCSKISSIRFSDYLNSLSLPALIGVFKANQWNSHALISIDSSLVYSIIDVLLGGRKSVQFNQRNNVKAYTTIERNLVERLINVILDDFKEAFAPVCDIDFSHERMESNPRFATIVRDSNVTMKVTFKIEMDDRGGHFDIVIPYSSIEPARDLLLQNFMGEKFGRDNIWEIHLADKIREAYIRLEATLPIEELSLREVLNWKKGSYVQLSSTTQSPIHLTSENFELFLGKMGQKNGHIAVKVNDVLFGKNGETQ